jgi:hypothetical protein
MNNEADHVAPFLETWGRRTLTISSCLLIWLLLLTSFPLLLITDAIIDLSRGGEWVITRCVLFLPLYFSCEVFGIIASLVIWLASGVWTGASRERFLDWNFALQRWWANALCRGAQRIFRVSIEVDGADEIRDGPVIVFTPSCAEALVTAIESSS